MPSISPQLADAMHLGQPGAMPDYQPLLRGAEQRIKVSSNGRPCEPAPGSVTPPSAEGANVAIILYFACAQSPKELTIHDDLFDMLVSDYHTLAKIEWPGGMQQFAFQPEARETTITIATIGESSRGVGSFFLLGIEHILTGYDHLLFLLALILRGGNVWSLLKIITAFTLAHSITLALAVLNIVTLPEQLVEATIALSIAYVAAGNLFMRKAASHRWAVSTCWVLAGFGFSNVLRELVCRRKVCGRSTTSISASKPDRQLRYWRQCYSILAAAVQVGATCRRDRLGRGARGWTNPVRRACLVPQLTHKAARFLAHHADALGTDEEALGTVVVRAASIFSVSLML
jgi:hypothetical protein